MNESIKVVGFADAAGNGAELSTAFTEADFEKAKQSHRFPDGVKCFKMSRVVEIDRAEFIGENIGEFLEKTEAEKVAAAKVIADKQAEAGKLPAAIAAAQKKVRETARVRNDLMGRLHSAKSKLANHEGTPEDLRSKSHEGAVKEIQKMIFGDPEKKITGLEAQVAESVKAYDAAAADFEAITKPTNEKLSPAPKSQFVEA